jgi:hypothetical protein
MKNANFSSILPGERGRGKGEVFFARTVFHVFHPVGIGGAR